MIAIIYRTYNINDSNLEKMSVEKILGKYFVLSESNENSEKIRMKMTTNITYI